ncbi:protein phosphatase 1 regulatory subunit 36 [Cetorhinus maximus]
MDGYLNLEKLIAAVPAQWVWKDDTNTLELVSLLPSPDTKEKRPSSRIRTFMDPLNQGFENSKTGIFRHSIAMLRKALSNGKVLGSALEVQKSSDRRGQYVTLEDVKQAAFLLLKEYDSLRISLLFQQMLGTRHLNEFLMTLLSYFSAFLSKYDLESKPGIFVTALDQIEIAEANAKMDLARKLMAQIYSRLLLGLGMAEQHHMACGKAMGSSTHKDRQLYESFYSYCAYVTWVTYGRKNLDVINSEIGRLLRSDFFNPAQKVKREETSKSSQGSSRWLQPRRPPINKILNQRSPVLKSLLQTPREKSEYLFKQHRVNPHFSTDLADEKIKAVHLESNLSNETEFPQFWTKMIAELQLCWLICSEEGERPEAPAYLSQVGGKNIPSSCA